MVTCPNCWGLCNMEKIQLEECSTDWGDFFYCKRCNNFSELKIIDEIDELELPDEVRNMKASSLGGKA